MGPYKYLIVVQRWYSGKYALKTRVPKDKLLIWNVKDGWEPVCRFLKKEVPKVPFPQLNKASFIYQNFENS